MCRLDGIAATMLAMSVLLDLDGDGLDQLPDWPGSSKLVVAPAQIAGGTGEIALPPQPNNQFSGPVANEGLASLEAKFAECMSTINLHFQPIVHTVGRRRFGYEALLRSSSKALPHPGAVLDAAERLERITHLGREIRNQVAKTMATEPAERGVVFVNLHLLDVLDKSLISPFSPLSRMASRIVLEITERTSLDAIADLRFRVAELRELGFRIAIDDLGGGHERMRTFGLGDTDFVKLDMALVRDVDKVPMKQQLVASLISLCREKGTLVIGEGVETEAEANTLQALGCDLLQGYFIARPAPPFCDAL